ncbi:MAG: hypothetical protein OHK0021_01800 [Bryobacter sp.]
MPVFLLLFFAYMPFVDNVFVRGQGPYRFAVDTGGQSSIIHTRLARSLGLTPEFRVELVTQAGNSLAPGSATTLAVGGHELAKVETLFLELEDQVGILGQSALRHLDYTIDVGRNRVVLESHPEGMEKAEVFPLRYSFDHILLPVEIGGRTYQLALDSGSNVLLVPGSVPGFRALEQATLLSHTGSTKVRTGHLRCLKIGRFQFRNIAAALLPGAAQAVDGLIPAQFFHKIHISNRTGKIYLL